jgi:DNA-binding CsgD family transcriptional regulator
VYAFSQDATQQPQRYEHPQELLSTLILPELIEAAVRSGHTARAADALEPLAETTRAAATEWALGTEARSRALLAANQAAEDLYREAIDRLGRTGLGVEAARARLPYGEWLRRHRRRGEARDQLRAGYEIFVSAGAGAFAERARTELRATGERVPKRTAQTRNVLTAREAHIARLAGHGASNPEIAAQLFISSATVAYHLRKVFTTLGITSRSQFAKALPQNQTEPAGQVAGTEGLPGGGARRRRLSRRLSGRWRRLSGYADATQRPHA